MTGPFDLSGQFRMHFKRQETETGAFILKTEKQKWFDDIGLNRTAGLIGLFRVINLPVSDG